MIPASILNEHTGKEVQVHTTRGAFDGILEIRNAGALLILKPNDDYTSSRYGSIYIDATAVVAIREIKPRPKKQYEDEGEEDSCEKENPKKYAKVKDVGVPDDESPKKNYLPGVNEDKYMIRNETENKK